MGTLAQATFPFLHLISSPSSFLSNTHNNAGVFSNTHSLPADS